MRKIWKWALLLLTLFLLTKKFYYQKDLGHVYVPNPVDILDERDYAYVGYTFRKEGVATGWSMLDAYKTTEIERGRGEGMKYNFLKTNVVEIDVGKGTEHMLMVRPYLDHSPLAGVIYSWGIRNNPQTMADLEVGDYRRTALMVSCVSGFLIAIAGWIVSKSILAGLLSFWIYSTASTYILSSRLALIENILIPISLLVIIILNLLSKTKKEWLQKVGLMSAGIMTGLGISVKESGVYILILGIIFLARNKWPKKKWLWYLIPSLLVGSWFYVYGFVIDKELMSEIFLNQKGRAFFGSLNFLVSLLGPNFKNFPLDGFWLWGWFGLIMAARKKKMNDIVVGSGAYLGVMLLMGGANYPWYWLPLIPFLAIAGGMELKKMVVNPKPLRIAAFFLLPFSGAFYWGFANFRQNNALDIYRLAVLIFALGTIFWSWKNRLSRGVVARAMWILFAGIVLYQINQWNLQGFQYIVENWSQLPELFLVKTL